METIRISSKFQVVIPKKIRESIRLKPGQQMQVIAYGNRIEFIATSAAKSMRGFLGNIDASFRRKADRL